MDRSYLMGIFLLMPQGRIQDEENQQWFASFEFGCLEPIIEMGLQITFQGPGSVVVTGKTLCICKNNEIYLFE